MSQPTGPLRLGFALEQTLGHVTHSSNLHKLIPEIEGIEPHFADVHYAVSGWPSRVPGYRNWTIRSGLRARRAIRQFGSLDALFIHTQVPAILNVGTMKRLPTVVSLDATPLQYDDLGVQYGHETAGRRLERLKWRLNRRCFLTARAVVTWSHWTKGDLVDRYGVPIENVHVIPPGVDVGRWTDGARPEPGRDRPVRILFVGADFQRKGGQLLVEAVRRLRAAGLPVEVDLVTRQPQPVEPGVRSHLGLQPNTPALIDLYRHADLFCLPTLGDCLPMVLCEAAAVGLPLVSTDVGAVHEVVRDHSTGRLVPVGDTEALAAAIGDLARDPALRLRLGTAAQRLVHAEYDAAVSARRLVQLMRSIADGPGQATVKP